MTSRCVALATADPALYGEIASTLRERHIPCVSLLPGQRIPARVAVVLTTPAEMPLVDHPRVLAIPEDGDRPALWAAVGHALLAARLAGDLVVGIDPGPRPGYAILAGSVCVGQGILESPEAGASFAGRLRHRFPSRAILYRVGAGDPIRRDRIVNGLLAHHRTVELVNEQRTTPHGHRRPRDMEAARRIAMSSGRLVRAPLATPLTPGEVSDLQRLSRIGSGGRLTIGRDAARRVLRGELTLSEAVANAMDPSRPRPESSPASPSSLREPL